MKNLVFPDEFRATSRKNMAEIYRKIRKDNPAIARLLFKRQKNCVNELVDIVLYGPSNIEGGLRALLK